MAPTEREFGELMSKVDTIIESVKCLPKLSQNLAVLTNRVDTLEKRADANSARGWQVTLSAIGAVISMMITAVIAFIKGGK